MPDAILIQAASWEYAPLLDITAKRHADYAQKHGMSFECLRGRWLDGSAGVLGWDKLVLIQQALRAGFEHVFWIDADAAIVGDEDLRGALTHGTLGMVQHPGPPIHFNCGVMMMRNTQRLGTFLEAVLSYCPGIAPWWEQNVLNDLITSEKWFAFERLDDRWNSTFGVNESDHPVVVGWHGAGDVFERAALMRCVLGE
jgi:hypothetical protein